MAKMNVKKKAVVEAVEAPSNGGELTPDFRIVDLDKVEPNDYNPNEMEAEYFEALVKATEHEGMNQPVLVRPHPTKPGHFVIVDGENRYKSVQFLGRKKLPVIVVPFSEAVAKARTISFNNLRGNHIPLKLARVMVDLHKEFSAKEVRSLTGIVESDQINLMSLLEVPQFKPTGPKLPAQKPIATKTITISLSPDESRSYTDAMKRAMKLLGADIVALIGNEVPNFDEALTTAMGIAGVKLRNVALALICETFNKLGKDKQAELIAAAKKAVYDKAESDATAKAAAKTASDKKVAGWQE